MAFDADNATHRSEMRDELANDPQSIGYAAVSGVTRDLLALLNDPANHPGSPTTNRPTEELDIPEVAGVIDADEYAALPVYDQEWVKMFISRPETVTLRPYQAKFLSIFPASGTPPVGNTRPAVLALLSKAASRAEELWGVNTVITRNDLNRARNET